MLNKVFLIGRIGKKTYKSTKNGSHMCTLNVATERKYIDSKGNNTKATTWHRVNFFHQRAEVVEKYAQVGDLIHIEGEIMLREIEKDGVTFLDYSVTGDKPTFIPNTKRDNFIKHEDNHGTAIPSSIQDDEEIPF